MKAKDIMTNHPISLRMDASVRDAIEMIREMDIRHIPIVDKDQLVGIVSDRDLQGVSFAEDSNFGTVEKRSLVDTPLQEVMRTDIISVSPDTPIGEVVDILIEEKIGAVPVIHETSGNLVGIVSYVDVLNATREFFDIAVQ